MPKCDLLCNFIEITPRHGCPPVNLLHIFLEHRFLRTPLGGCFYALTDCKKALLSSDFTYQKHF